MQHQVFFLICIHIMLQAVAALDARWNEKQLCYIRKGGVCVRRDSSCPFEDAGSWRFGCPSGYFCCVPPPVIEKHKRITTIQCGKKPMGEKEDYRVIGGFKAKIGELPWQALIRNYGSAHCGASILSERWILTAAHCLVYFPSRKRSFTVSTGLTSLDSPENSQQQTTIEEDFIHPKYDNPEFGNDIGLIFLRKPLRFDNFTQPICLPRRNDTFKDRVCTVSGWGWNGEEHARNLTALNLPTMSYEKCKRSPKSGPFVYKSNLCAGFDAGERDACEGDSGGPFACRMNSGQWVLPGIVSWGEGCALAGEPAVFAKVASFLDWIEKVTGLTWN